MSSDPAPRWEPLDDHLLKEIYDSDQAMYPAPELSYARLKSWAAACPELCLALRSEPSTTSEADETVQGLIIVLPLRQPSWDRLRLAEISEHDVDAASMFPPSVVDDSVAEGGDEEKAAVGLHVFHIERFPGFVEVWKESKFTALALEEIRCRVADLFKAWHVVGYSGEKPQPQMFLLLEFFPFASRV